MALASDVDTIEALRRSPAQLVSVIMPVRNAAHTVVQQLNALAQQDYSGAWELVVVDNGSTDQTKEVVTKRLRALGRGTLLGTARAAGNGASAARNCGAAAASGDLLAFCDADDVASPGWLSALVLDAGDADIIAGRVEVNTLNAPTLQGWHDPPSEQRELRLHRYLPRISSGSCAVWFDVFDALGGFDEDHPGAEDVDFAWRAQLAGYRLRVVEKAVVAYRYRSELRAIARQHYRWGKGEARLYRDFAAAGMPRAPLREALRAWAEILWGLPALPFSCRRRGWWTVRTGRRLGRLAGSIGDRVLFP